MLRHTMKSLLTLVSILLVTTLSYAADIRGYYTPVGPVPSAHTVKKVRFEELLNFGHSAHDDTVDSMVLTMGGLLRRGKLEIDYNSNSFDL